MQSKLDAYHGLLDGVEDQPSLDAANLEAKRRGLFTFPMATTSFTPFQQYSDPQHLKAYSNSLIGHSKALEESGKEAEEALKRSQAAEAAAKTEESTTKTIGEQRGQAIAEAQAAMDPTTGIVSPSDQAAIQARYPKVKIPDLSSSAFVQQFVRSGVPAEKIPEFDINTLKSRLGIMGNDRADFFMAKYAQNLGKTVPQLSYEEYARGAQEWAHYNKDPQMEAMALAQGNLAMAMKKMQLDQMPTAEDASNIAGDIRAHRLAPDQFSIIRGRGAGALGVMVEREMRKQDPEFNWEKASSEYNLVKSPTFQQNIRYMDYVNSSIDNVIRDAAALNNTKFRSINAMKNAAKDQLNNVDLAKFNTARTEVADSIAKVLQGGGTGSGTSDKKLEQGMGLIRDTDSLDVVRAVAGEIKSLMGNRRTELTRGTYMENAAPTGQKPTSAPLTINMGGKLYQYKGSGPTNDLNSYTEIRQ
jgi:hypothetical protein